MRKKPNLIPRMEKCSFYQIREEAQKQGRWRQAFPSYSELYLELGCGKGRFTVETAKATPHAMLIAVERVPEAMVVGMERAMAEELTNVRFVDMDASRVTEVFAEGEVDRIYINFCDPWPGGKKYAKRRLTAPAFLARYRQILKPGGEIHFKTDNAPLFAYSLEQFAEQGYRLSEVTDDLHGTGICGVMTDYEAKFYEQGIPIHRCVATPLPVSPTAEGR